MVSTITSRGFEIGLELSWKELGGGRKSKGKNYWESTYFGSFLWYWDEQGRLLEFRPISPSQQRCFWRPFYMSSEDEKRREWLFVRKDENCWENKREIDWRVEKEGLHCQMSL